MSKLRIYLAGGAFETSYRDTAKLDFGSKFMLVDPMVENGVIIDTENQKIITDKTPKQIVELDKSCIENCDILVAYINKYSAGTMMEILHAYNHNIPIYLIVTPGRGFETDIWLRYHSNNAFFSIDECFNNIHEQLTS